MVRSIALRRDTEGQRRRWRVCLLALTWTSIDVKANGDCCAAFGPIALNDDSIEFLTLRGKVDLEAVKNPRSGRGFTRGFKDVTNSAKLPLPTTCSSSFLQLERKERALWKPEEAINQMVVLRSILPWAGNDSSQRVQRYAMPFYLFECAVGVIHRPERGWLKKNPSKACLRFAKLIHDTWKASWLHESFTPPHLETAVDVSMIYTFSKVGRNKSWLSKLRSRVRSEQIRRTRAAAVVPSDVAVVPTPETRGKSPSKVSHWSGENDRIDSRKRSHALSSHTAAPLESWTQSVPPPESRRRIPIPPTSVQTQIMQSSRPTAPRPAQLDAPQTSPTAPSAILLILWTEPPAPPLTAQTAPTTAPADCPATPAYDWTELTLQCDLDAERLRRHDGSEADVITDDGTSGVTTEQLDSVAKYPSANLQQPTTSQTAELPATHLDHLSMHLNEPPARVSHVDLSHPECSAHSRKSEGHSGLDFDPSTITLAECLNLYHQLYGDQAG